MCHVSRRFATKRLTRGQARDAQTCFQCADLRLEANQRQIATRVTSCRALDGQFGEGGHEHVFNRAACFGEGAQRAGERNFLAGGFVDVAAACDFEQDVACASGQLELVIGATVCFGAGDLLARAAQCVGAHLAVYHRAFNSLARQAHRRRATGRATPASAPTAGHQSEPGGDH